MPLPPLLLGALPPALPPTLPPALPPALPAMLPGTASKVLAMGVGARTGTFSVGAAMVSAAVPYSPKYCSTSFSMISLYCASAGMAAIISAHAARGKLMWIVLC
jgi:hypothetical protein